MPDDSNLSSAIRAALEARTREVAGNSPAIIAGSRQQTFEPGSLPAWEWGVAVISDSLEDFDDLYFPVRKAIEADHTLGGIAIDVAVSKILGPALTPDKRASCEWIVQISHQED